MPLVAEGMPKGKTFFYGVLSGAVEPIAALVTILAANAVIPVLPSLRTKSFAEELSVSLESLACTRIHSMIQKEV